MAIKQQVLAELERHKGEYVWAEEIGGNVWARPEPPYGRVFRV